MADDAVFLWDASDYHNDDVNNNFVQVPLCKDTEETATAADRLCGTSNVVPAPPSAAYQFFKGAGTETDSDSLHKFSVSQKAQARHRDVEAEFEFASEPTIPIRVKRTNFSPDTDDVVFQLLDVTVQRDEYFSDSDTSVSDNSTTGGGTRREKEIAVYLHGNLINGETVLVRFRGYRPFFYLSIPESGTRVQDERWVSSFLTDLASLSEDAVSNNNKHQAKDSSCLPNKELLDTQLVYQLPTTGFRNGEPLPFLLFRFKTRNAFYRYKHCLQKMFPPPTEAEVKRGVYRNEIMVCEADIPQDIKFANQFSIQMSGWVKLSAGTYSSVKAAGSVNDAFTSRAMHTFSTSCLEGLAGKDDLADCLIDSVDIEAIRNDGALAMPVATEVEDCIACIGHAMESTKRSFDRMYYLFTWGGPVILPEFDRKGKPLPKRKVVMKIYKDEATMLNHWVRWHRMRAVSPDCTIGWNIFGFDLAYIATRVRKLAGIDSDAREWGRLYGYETPVVPAKIESKAIPYSQYYLTPSPGNVFLDLMVRFSRDVTLRLKSYRLASVAAHFLDADKDDVHFSEIKSLFYGTPKEKGLLMAYNLQDADLVLDLFFIGEWPKTMNICRVNRVPMAVLCTRGQQIRVFGGYHKQAVDNGYVVYRPHYHPILDEPIVEDPHLWAQQEAEADKAHAKFEQQCNYQALEDYWTDQLARLQSVSKEEPMISFVEGGDQHVTHPPLLVDPNNNNTTTTSTCGLAHVPGKLDVPLSDNVKVYGQDTNPFSGNSDRSTKHYDRQACCQQGEDNGHGKQKENRSRGDDYASLADTFKAPDGKTVQEIDRLFRVKKRKKFIYQANTGTNLVVEVVGKGKKRTRNDEEQEDDDSLPADTNGCKRSLSQTYHQSNNDDHQHEEADNGDKGFAGGKVMKPVTGLHENVATLDFNALYPNVMMSYSLDPALLVLDPKYANCPGVTYLKIRFNKHKEFLFAWGHKGVLILHTKTLVASRKVAQAVQDTFDKRANCARIGLIRVANQVAKQNPALTTAEGDPCLLTLDDNEQFDKAIKITKEFLALNGTSGKTCPTNISPGNHLCASVVADLLQQELTLVGEALTKLGAGGLTPNCATLSDFPTLWTVIQQQAQSPTGGSQTAKEVSGCSVVVVNQYLRLLGTTFSSVLSTSSDTDCQQGTHDSYVVSVTDFLQTVALLFYLANNYRAEYDNYFSKQNELKVGSNSSFGFVGAGGRVQFSETDGRLRHKAMMQVMPISATTTYIGRKTIEAAKRVVEDEWPGHVVVHADGTRTIEDNAKVLYMDTDSLFISFPKSVIPSGVEGLNKTFDIAPMIADKITAKFNDFKGSSMKIVHEKTAKWIIFYSAKCYALYLFKKRFPADPGSIEIKGLPFSKRDCCKFVAKTCRGALDLILRHGKLEESKQGIKDRLMDMVLDRLTEDEIKIVKIKLCGLLEPLFSSCVESQLCTQQQSNAIYRQMKDCLLQTTTLSKETSRSLTEKLCKSFRGFVSSLPTSTDMEIVFNGKRVTIPQAAVSMLCQRLVELRVGDELGKLIKEKVVYERLQINKKLSKQSYSASASSSSPADVDILSLLASKMPGFANDDTDNAVVDIKRESFQDSDQDVVMGDVNDNEDPVVRLNQNVNHVSFDFPPRMPAHAQLANVINQRKPNLGPRTGESVQYLFVYPGLDAEDKKNHRWLRKKYIRCGDGWIEDFEHVLEKTDLEPDKLWYLQNQCRKNICTLYEPLMTNPGSLVDDAVARQTQIQYGICGTNNDTVDDIGSVGSVTAQTTVAGKSAGGDIFWQMNWFQNVQQQQQDTRSETQQFSLGLSDNDMTLL